MLVFIQNYLKKPSLFCSPPISPNLEFVFRSPEVVQRKIISFCWVCLGFEIIASPISIFNECFPVFSHSEFWAGLCLSMLCLIHKLEPRVYFPHYEHGFNVPIFLYLFFDCFHFLSITTKMLLWTYLRKCPCGVSVLPLLMLLKVILLGLEIDWFLIFW